MASCLPLAMGIVCRSVSSLVHEAGLKLEVCEVCVSSLSLRVQVPNNPILPQNLYYNYYYPNRNYWVHGPSAFWVYRMKQESLCRQVEDLSSAEIQQKNCICRTQLGL